jgi:hypothetical protein
MFKDAGCSPHPPRDDWRHPVEGSGPRVGSTGATLRVLGYAGALRLFASVKQLQFWNYRRFRRSVQAGTQCVTVFRLDPYAIG